MKASVMLDKTSMFEVLKLDGNGTHSSILLLHKSTETGSPFVVVAGYFLTEVGKFEESVLAEIETVPESDYAKMKELIRRSQKSEDRVPITFW
ncbi:MAG: hypothetical protein ACYC7D_00015 [Nitrososphaerales archaeon]